MDGVGLEFITNMPFSTKSVVLELKNISRIGKTIFTHDQNHQGNFNERALSERATISLDRLENDFSVTTPSSQDHICGLRWGLVVFQFKTQLKDTKFFIINIS